MELQFAARQARAFEGKDVTTTSKEPRKGNLLTCLSSPREKGKEIASASDKISLSNNIKINKKNGGE